MSQEEMMKRLMQAVNDPAKTSEIKGIIDKGLDVNIRWGSDHWTPLMLAAQSSSRNNLAGMKELINLKADVNIKDPRGRTALYHAVMTDHLERMDMLKDTQDMNSVNSHGVTALQWAVHERKFELAKKLLEFRASMHVGDGIGGETPLKAAKDAGGPFLALFGITSPTKAEL